MSEVNVVTGGKLRGGFLSEMEGLLHLVKIDDIGNDQANVGIVQINNENVIKYEVMNKTNQRVTYRESSRKSGGVYFKGLSTRSGGTQSQTTSESIKTFTIKVDFQDDTTSVIKTDEFAYELFLASVHSDPVEID